MPDYIDRAAAIEVAEKYGCGNGSVLGAHSGIADDIAYQISLIPTVDAVSVIRCKDCRFGHFYKSGAMYCTSPDGLAGIVSDDFCSYAERKEKLKRIQADHP